MAIILCWEKIENKKNTTFLTNKKWIGLSFVWMHNNHAMAVPYYFMISKPTRNQSTTLSVVVGSKDLDYGQKEMKLYLITVVETSGSGWLESLSKTIVFFWSIQGIVSVVGNYSGGDEGVCPKKSCLIWTVEVLRTASWQEGGTVERGS